MQTDLWLAGGLRFLHRIGNKRTIYQAPAPVFSRRLTAYLLTHKSTVLQIDVWQQVMYIKFHLSEYTRKPSRPNQRIPCVRKFKSLLFLFFDIF
jgi:hypothetical protein